MLANASTHVSARGQRALLGLGARGGMQARPSQAVPGLHRPKSERPQRRGSRACSRRQGQAAASAEERGIVPEKICFFLVTATEAGIH